MSDTLFKDVRYSLSGLIDVFYIQRPFDWANDKVRDMSDSMCRGYQKLLDEEN